MYNKCIIVGCVHLIVVILIIQTAHVILPHCVACCYNFASHFIICIIIARITFRFTKENILSSTIKHKGKAVLITGCDSGFGNGLAKRLDSKGYHVFATCLFPNGSGADDLRKSCSNRLQILELDVTKDDSVKTARDFVKSNLGKSELWAVVNNAGVLKGFSTEVSSIQMFKDSMDVHGFGAVRVTKAFLPFLKKSKGRVVNVTSVAGRIGLPYFSPYTMSKFAAQGLSECLRRELYAWGIRVITVEPEGFKTEMTNPKGVVSRVTVIEEDFVAAYGEKFVKDFKGFLANGDKLVSPKVSKVLDDLEKAVSLEHPDVAYQPCRNIFLQDGIRFFFLFPLVVQDLSLAFIQYAVKWPSPESCRK